MTDFNLDEKNDEEIVVGTDIANAPMRDDMFTPEVTSSPDFRSLPSEVNRSNKQIRQRLDQQFKSLGAINSEERGRNGSEKKLTGRDIDVDIHSLGKVLFIFHMTIHTDYVSIIWKLNLEINHSNIDFRPFSGSSVRKN